MSDGTFESGVLAQDSFDDAEANYTATGSAKASADENTGELKIFADIDVNATSVPEGFEELTLQEEDFSSASVFATAELTEVFSITGTGTATFNMVLDAELVGPSSVLNTSIFARSLADGSSLGRDSFSSIFPDSDTSVMDEVLTVSIDFVDAVNERVSIRWRTAAIANGRSGCNVFEFIEDCAASTPFEASSVDSLSTGNIFFAGEDGLDIFVSTDGFLSDSAFQTYAPGGGNDVNAVPLPASAWMLLAGLLGLGGFRNRKPT